MNEILGLFVIIFAVLGVLLNNRRIIYCFYVWLISNSISAYIHLDSNLYSLFIRDIIFFVLAIEGIYKWRKK